MIAAVLIIAGAALRYHYFFLEQILLNLLIAFSVAVLLFWVLMSGPKRIRQTYKDSLIYAVVVAVLCGFTYESAASNKHKNQKYFEKLARIISAHIEKHHTAPESVEDALASSYETLPNRGDADGNPYIYLRLSDRIFILRTLGRNGKNDSGHHDDVRMNYLNGTSVSFAQLSSWIDVNGTPEEKEMLEVYLPVLRHKR